MSTTDTPAAQPGQVPVGISIAFPAFPEDREETAGERGARRVDAASLHALASNPRRTVSAPVSIVNAVVDEELDFSFAAFEAEVSFAGTRFEKHVSFEGARFGRHATFSRCHFAGGVSFRAATADYDLAMLDARLSTANLGGLSVGRRFDATGAEFGCGGQAEAVVFANATLRQAIFPRATFHGSTNFRGVKVELELDLRGARFGGKANFTRATVGGEVICGPWEADAHDPVPTRFEAEAIFHRCVFRSLAWFREARFEQDALFMGCAFENDARFHHAVLDGTTWTGATVAGDLDFDHATLGTATFDRAKVAGDLLLTDTAFRESASFRNASVAGEMAAVGTRFEGEADFSYVRASGPACFEPSGERPTCFASTACFDWSVFDRSVNMTGVRFGAGASFVRAEVRDSLAFEGASFNGPLSLWGAEVDAALSFEGAIFAGETDFTELSVGRGASWGPGAAPWPQRLPGAAAFARARIGGDLDLSRVEFGGKADFSGARVAGAASFVGSVFRAAASFPGAQFADLRFRPGVAEPAPACDGQFGGPVDLCGAKYARIEVAYGELLDHVASESDEPFLFLENVLRAMGCDGDADRVYRRLRRRNTRRLKARSRLRWLADAAYGALAGYGLRPDLLVYASLAVLALGTFVFQLPRAVVPGDPPAGVAPAPTTISVYQAAGVSLNQFLPLDIPSGSAWEPSDEPIAIARRRTIAFRTWATVQTIFGYLLVPLFVGVASGLLLRKRES